jgi:uncharacterized protein YbjQ (UPF0145 family)
MSPASKAAAGRLERLRGRTIRTGLLSVEEATALAGVGFEPVSEVIGAIASTVTPRGFYASGAVTFQQQRSYNQPVGVGAGYSLLNAWDLRTYTSSSGNRQVGTPPELTALKAGYRTALARLGSEARAVGADGVVGITIERTVGHSGGTQLWSFLALGTAVRSTGRTHTANPFTTTQSAAAVAAGIRGGWIPVSVLFCPVMGIRYVDWASRTARRGLLSNAEVEAFTDVVNTCRHQARQDFAAAARAVRADGAVMTDMTLALEAERQEPVCNATVIISGTALARFGVRGDRPPPLTIMPLSRGSSL